MKPNATKLTQILRQQRILSYYMCAATFLVGVVFGISII